MKLLVAICSVLLTTSAWASEVQSTQGNLTVTTIIGSLSGDVTGSPSANTLKATQGNVTTLTAPVTVVSTLTVLGAVKVGGIVSNVTTPVAAADAANKTYVDNLAPILDFKAPAFLVAVTALPANAYANGSSGVGATITGLGLGLLTIDGVSPPVGKRVLINGETASHNGLYTVTTNAGGVFFVLTRATDHDSAAEMAGGSMVEITSGVTYDSSTWVQQTDVATVGTDAVNFYQTNGLGDVTASNGIQIIGNNLSLDPTKPITQTSGTFTTGIKVSTASSSNQPALQVQSDNTVRFQAGGDTTTVHRVATILYQNFNSSAAVANTAFQQLGYYFMPPGTLQNIGDSIYILCQATFTAVSEAKLVTASFGGTQIVTSAVATSGAAIWGENWVMKYGSNQQYASGKFNISASANYKFNALTVTESAGIAITCGGSTANGTNPGDVTVYAMQVILYPAP